MKVNAIQIRPGNAMEHEGKLWVVQKIDIIQPGKGASVIQIEMRDVRAGNKTNVRFRTQETVERVQLEEYDYSYLYQDGNDYVFMNQESFEQVMVPVEKVGDQAPFLKENMICQLQTYEGEVISATLPDKAVYEVAEAEPVVKGQTASSSYKPAILDNGAKVMVPPHIEVGTRIVVNIHEAKYVERAKD